MTIRNRLTLLFAGIVSALLLVFCLVLYLVAEWHRETEFRERLRAEGFTSVELLFGSETISPQLFKLLDKNQMTVLTEEEIIIYNRQNQIIYESGTDYLTIGPAILNRVRTEREVFWRDGQREIVGEVMARSGLIVFASAVDKYGRSKQQNLALMLAIGFLVSVGAVLLAGRVLAGRLLLPLQRIIERMDTVTASDLSRRLDEGTDRDELTQLAQRFNRMLDRLEEAFRLQRAFVSNASHELRTPLTAITGQLEVSLLTDDDPAEMRATMQSVLDDARSLNRMANGLLSLANASVDASAVRMGPVALDDLVNQAAAEVQRLQPGYHVSVDLAGRSKSAASDFILTGNDTLLLTAVLNLIENAGKFAPDHRAAVRVTAHPDTIAVAVQNNGPAIPAAELPELFKPFRRGSNARQVAGYGVGLSLVERVVKLHRGRISVESDDAAGTTFTMTLPR
jgi:signal transduction histidine kinase